MKRNRIKQLVRRSLRERTRGAAHYNKAAAALQQAISAGLMEGQAVAVELCDEATGEKKTVEFELINNFAGDKAYRNASIPKFELKKVPKNPRSKPSAVASAVSADPEAARE
jgi:hypothetical protein